MPNARLARPTRPLRALLAASALGLLLAGGGQAEVALTSSFTRSVAEAAAADDAIAAFYRLRDYQTIWTGPADATRREAFLTALAGASAQGLPPRDPLLISPLPT